MKMFGIKRLREQDVKEYFFGVHNHILSTKMYMEIGEKISQINVRETMPGEDTPHYAWKCPNGKIEMVFPSKVQVEICFPYGAAMATRSGGGHLIQVVITEINDEKNFCDKFSETEKEAILAFFYELELRGMSPHSLMEDFHKTFGKYPEICISTKIDSSRVTIAQRNNKENLHYITIDDEIEFYYIGFEDRQWFFKEYNTYKYIKLIIYGKVNPQ